MKIHRTRWNEIKFLFRKLNRRRAERELEEEIGTHLEFERSEKVENGYTPEAARDATMRAFGGVLRAKEGSRAVWGFGSLERIWMDLRYGGRALLKNPGFSAIAIVTLSLG